MINIYDFMNYALGAIRGALRGPAGRLEDEVGSGGGVDPVFPCTYLTNTWLSSRDSACGSLTGIFKDFKSFTIVETAFVR